MAEIIRRVDAGEEFYIPRVEVEDADTLHWLIRKGANVTPLNPFDDAINSIENAPPPRTKLPPGHFESFKLKAELIPKQLWHINLRKAMGRSKWKKIREEVCNRQGGVCAICNTRGRLECHEHWRFEDHDHILRLIEFLGLCKLCHHVKHLGLARVFERKGILDFETIIQHFQQVNGCTRYEFNAHESAAKMEWIKRNRIEWKADFGDFAVLLNSSAPAQG